MKKAILFFILISSIVLLESCQSEPKTVETKSVETISKIEKNTIFLKNDKTIELPQSAAEGVSTLFIIRPGDYQKDVTREIAQLTIEGQQYATHIMNFFEPVNLKAILGIGAVYVSQTGDPLADKKEIKLFTYNNVDYGALLNYVYAHEIGKKFVVIETEDKISDLLYTLSGDKSYKTIEPFMDYNEMYVVKTPKRGKAEIHRLKF